MTELIWRLRESVGYLTAIVGLICQSIVKSGYLLYFNVNGYFTLS